MHGYKAHIFIYTHLIGFKLPLCSLSCNAQLFNATVIRSLTLTHMRMLVFANMFASVFIGSIRY